MNQLTKKYDKEKKALFGVFWESSLTSNYFHFGPTLDEDLLNLFKDLNKLKNTFIFFLSDQGYNIGLTYETKIEMYNPFLFIIPPKWFKTKYPYAFDNLKINSKRLMSVFDIHETLIALYSNNMDFDKAENSKSISLFKEISEYRQCNDIGVHYCSCMQNLKNYDNAVDFMIKRMNSKLEGYKNCAKLQKDAILDGKEIEHNRYNVVFRTYPNFEIFEAQVNYFSNNTLEFYRVQKYSIPENKSNCLDDNVTEEVRMYCYCILF